MRVLNSIFLATIFFMVPIVGLAQFQLDFIPVSNTPVTPTASVDIVVEGDTYTPALYRGRAEPSLENRLRLIAIVHGLTAPNQTDLSYRWFVNDRNVTTDSGLPEVLSITANPLSEVVVRVVVTDAAGTLVAEKTTAVAVAEPHVVFYEDNPLRGRSDIAIGERFQLFEGEATIIAEPYFVGADDTPPQLVTTWSIDGTEVDPLDSWNRITLTAGENEFTTRRQINFTAYHHNKVLQRIDAGFLFETNI